MAVHASSCWRYVGTVAILNTGVAVTAINAQISGVELVTVSNRLYGTITDIREFG